MTGKDKVNHPRHYTQGGLECIDAIEEMLAQYKDTPFISMCCGNALKYIWRHQHKDAPIEDLEKAIWYINKAIDWYRKNQK